jgi:hypothetical protein
MLQNPKLYYFGSAKILIIEISPPKKKIVKENEASFKIFYVPNIVFLFKKIIYLFLIY